MRGDGMAEYLVLDTIPLFMILLLTQKKDGGCDIRGVVDTDNDGESDISNILYSVAGAMAVGRFSWPSCGVFHCILSFCTHTRIIGIRFHTLSHLFSGI